MTVTTHSHPKFFPYDKDSLRIRVLKSNKKRQEDALWIVSQIERTSKKTVQSNMCTCLICTLSGHRRMAMPNTVEVAIFCTPMPSRNDCIWMQTNWRAEQLRVPSHALPWLEAMAWWRIAHITSLFSSATRRDMTFGESLEGYILRWGGCGQTSNTSWIASVYGRGTTRTALGESGLLEIWHSCNLTWIRIWRSLMKESLRSGTEQKTKWWSPVVNTCYISGKHDKDLLSNCNLPRNSPGIEKENPHVTAHRYFHALPDSTLLSCFQREPIDSFGGQSSPLWFGSSLHLIQKIWSQVCTIVNCLRRSS